MIFKKLGSDTIKGLNGNIVLYHHLNKDLTDDFTISNLNQYRLYSHELYKLLIEPFLNKLQKNLIVIADNLATLTWSVLTSNNAEPNNPAHGYYLIYDCTFNSQPSASWWMKLRTRTVQSRFNFLSFAPEFENLKFNIEEGSYYLKYFN